ncbi:hypothetical protein GCM10010466_62640 [Planomonospora alba]|uniref:Protein kinase domain-containing protein n=1 Tax=Planomonospora alba TaxID=161354 RepID=A0ABP6NZP4_9ACTN
MGALITGDPERIGDYWLAGRLGAGGQGVVYEAYDPDGNRVALKALHATAGGQGRERFAREAEAARRVASFCTARVIDVRMDGPVPYIVSEYVEGPSLRAAVADGRRFTGDELHRLGAAIATALTAIHDAGVVHRDLKPDNVLLSPDGPRVIDFGVARTADMSLTATGTVLGTPTYMAPETFAGQRTDTAVDVFAWGAVMLFAATGQDPFTADNLGSVMYRVLSLTPDLGALPPRLRPLVGAALEKDPAVRPTARDLLLALLSAPAQGTPELLAEGGRAARGLHVPQSADPALGTLAEDAYGGLSPRERELAAEVFLRLVTVGEDGHETARWADKRELLDRPEQDAAAVDRVLRAFSYLMVEKDGEIALSRPALVRAWPRLRSWIETDRDGLVVLGELSRAARRWAEHGRKDADLLRGSRLENAMRWAATGRRYVTLSSLEREFLDESTRLVRRGVRRRGLATVVLAVLLVVAVGAGAFAVNQSRTVAEQRDEATARRLALEVEALRATDPVRALLLSVAAYRIHPGPDSRAALIGSLAQRERTAFTDPTAAGADIRLLGEGTQIVVDRGGVRIHDVRTGRRIGGWSGLGLGDRRPDSAALSPSGRYLAVTAGRSVQIWETATGRRTAVHTLRLRRDDTAVAGYDQSDRVLGIVSDRGVSFLDTVTGRHVVPEARAPENGLVAAASVTDGAGKKTAPPVGTSFAIAPRGDLVAVDDLGDGVGLLRMADGEAPAGWHDGSGCAGRQTSAVAFSPGGRILACGKGSTLSFVDVRARRTLPERDALGWNQGTIRFSPDGRYLLSWNDRSIQVYQVSTGELVHVHRRSGATDARLDGATLSYLMDDTAVTLDLSDVVRPDRPFEEGNGGARLSPDGRYLAVEGDEVRIWDVKRRRPHWTVPVGDSEMPPSVEFAAGGSLLLVDGVLWDVPGRRKLTAFDRESTVAVSPDGATAAVHDGNAIELWDVRRGRWTGSIPFEGDGWLVFRPGGRTLATVGEPNRMIDLAGGRPTGQVYGMGMLSEGNGQLVFSADGTRFAIEDGNGRLSFWKGEGERHGPLFRAHNGTGQVVFAPRGNLAASLGADGEVQLWDASVPRKLGPAITGGPRDAVTLAFSADGSTLITVGTRGTLREYPVDPERLAGVLCARAGRTLTEAEWNTSAGDVPYRDVCGPAGRLPTAR